MKDITLIVQGQEEMWFRRRGSAAAEEEGTLQPTDVSVVKQCTAEFGSLLSFLTVGLDLMYEYCQLPPPALKKCQLKHIIMTVFLYAQNCFPHPTSFI